VISSSSKVGSVAILAILGALAGGAAGSAASPCVPQEKSATLPYEGTESVLGALLEIDVGLILSTWKIKGVMVCAKDGRPHACLLIENAYPCGLIEVVRQPARSHLAEASLVKFLEPIASVPLYGKSSSHTVESDQGSHLQFAEAHVYTFVPPFPELPGVAGLPIVHPLGPLFQVNYLSELDGFSWRTAFADSLLDPEAAAKKLALPSCESVPRVNDCAWKWGSWSPRIGFVNHPSEVMAAYVQALRAGRAASRPLGRVVLFPYPFEPRTGHFVAMLRPVRKPAVSIGRPGTRILETGALSKHSAYFFMHYAIFEECKGCLRVRVAAPRVPTW
jgi:hypothetical protein